jgi:hypothetical protein
MHKPFPEGEQEACCYLIIAIIPESFIRNKKARDAGNITGRSSGKIKNKVVAKTAFIHLNSTKVC